MGAVSGLGDDAIQLLHLRRMAHHLAEALLRLQLLAQQPVLGGQLQMSSHPLQFQPQFVEVEGLGDVVVGSQLHRLYCRLHGGKAGHDDHHCFRDAAA